MISKVMVMYRKIENATEGWKIKQQRGTFIIDMWIFYKRKLGTIINNIPYILIYIDMIRNQN